MSQRLWDGGMAQLRHVWWRDGTLVDAGTEYELDKWPSVCLLAFSHVRLPCHSAWGCAAVTAFKQ